MKNILLGFLLAMSISVSAVVKQEDGSVILSREESAQIYESFSVMVDAGKKQAAQIQQLQKKIRMLETGNCT